MWKYFIDLQEPQRTRTCPSARRALLRVEERALNTQTPPSSLPARFCLTKPLAKILMKLFVHEFCSVSFICGAPNVIWLRRRRTQWPTSECLNTGTAAHFINVTKKKGAGPIGGL